MNFITKINIPKSKKLIDYNSKIVSLGSCFADNVGAKFDYYKFQNCVNPFGIIFNPVSIEKLIFRAVTDHEFTDKDIFFHNERWQSYEVHSDLSDENKDLLIENLNLQLAYFKMQLSNASHVFITYGTSWVYHLKSSNVVVANCHKVAQNQFDKDILTVVTIEKAIQNAIDLIKQINPNCTFVFTISPVRHIKDGFVENQRSKSHLITALHNLQLAYFPSFEIMMDELRDYRFYMPDMLHPNQVAIDYIWERFTDSQISETIYPLMDEVCSIQKSLSHRPFNPHSESHHKFLESLSVKIQQLKVIIPHIKFC